MKSRLLKSLLLIVAAAGIVITYRRFSTEKSVPTPVPKPPEAAKASEPAANKLPGDAHEAKVLAMALEKKPGHTPVLFKLAKIESDEGHFHDAARHLQEIVRREPHNSEARLELGKVLFQTGDVQGAIQQTEEILKTNPSYGDALYNLGAIYGNLGNRERAAEYWKRLIALDPGSENGRKAKQMLGQLQTR
ncbi:MAG TPA: tetratricopeptide repeat protein, partial [Acidobacteriota bacterium]|nr:tetratricopeptide repeat protein [Acidobacteriota bacterium]